MRFVLVFASLLWLSACGYHLADSVTRLPQDVETLHVVLFENRTNEPYLENVVTERVIQRLQRIPELRLLPSGMTVDAVLRGSVQRYRIVVSAYDALDQPRQYRAELMIEAQLERASDGRILWRGQMLQSDEFLADPDLGRQADIERLAQGRIAVRLADDLYAMLTANF